MANIKLLYGYNDKENAIKCELTNIELTDDGAIYTAICDEGGTIIAPVYMFKVLYTVVIKTADELQRTVQLYARTPEAAMREAELKPYELIQCVKYA